MKKNELDKVKRQAYQFLKKYIEKYENHSGKHSFQTDHNLALDFLLGLEGTWHATSLEKQAASILETTLHIESWQEIKSESNKMQLIKEAEFHLPILETELKEKTAILDSMIKSSVASKAGKARAEKDPAYKALRQIENHYKDRKSIFKLRGRSTAFAVEMHAKYPEIKSLESIKRLITKLNKTNKLIPSK